MTKYFSKLLFFFLFFMIFGAMKANAEIKPGLPKLYLNDQEISSELYITDKQVYLQGQGFTVLGAKFTTPVNNTQRIFIGNTEIRLDLPSGIASIYQMESSSFIPSAYAVVNYQKANQTLWFSVKDLAPYLGYKYQRISDVDLYRLTDGSQTITEQALFEINTAPPKPPTVPATGPKSGEGKKSSPNKPDKNATTAKKVVYLTFDDGPNQYTPEILALLKKYNMKATFFMLYNGIHKYPDLMEQIQNDGHGIGLHGVTHRKNLFYKDSTSPVKEMDKANTALEDVLGITTKLVRVPYGSRPYLSNAMYKGLISEDYMLWDWNVDSADSSKAYVSPKIIETRVITGLKAKKVPVVLMHDKECTADSLEAILLWMSKNGYVSKPLTEDMTPLNWSK